jgi:hypothetical protein
MPVPALEKLRRWLKRRSFSLAFSPRFNDVCFERRKVRIQDSLGRERQLHVLLHECGHVLVFLARRRRRTREVAGASYHSWLRLQRSGSKAAKLCCLQEEMVAWDRGFKLARRLGIRVAGRKARLQRTRSVMTYVRAASGRRRSSRGP